MTPDTIYTGDCRETLSQWPDACIDSIVTDPPYGLSFMGKGWDRGVPGCEFWEHALRVAKPGAHLLAFGGTRTFHRLAVAIEDAGWEVRDCIMWVYSSGFPKSLDVSKAIDKAAGAEREVIGRAVYGDGHVQNSAESMGYGGCDPAADTRNITTPATDAARQWQGWGTALKPALEPITVARKPLSGTVAANVLQHGTGALNVDGCRVGTDGGTCRDGKASMPNDSGWENMRGHGIATLNAGRWPANLIHDGSDEVLELFPQAAPSKPGLRRNQNTGWKCSSPPTDIMVSYADSGSAARFFYCAKASKSERDMGCEHNHHPTVKPLALMRYLCRLVTPPNGIVLDMFTGSGSTLVAAKQEGLHYAGCELNEEYVAIARARIAAARKASPRDVQLEIDSL